MAGTPIKEKLHRDVEAAIDPASGLQGWEGVFARIASGETIASIAKTFGVSRGFFSTQMSRDPERRRLKDEAKKLAAEALADAAVEIMDGASTLTREALDKDKNRAHLRLALAGFYDKEQFGQKPQQQVTVNIGTLHLDAMRQRTVESLPAPVTELPVLEAELFDPTPSAPPVLEGDDV